MDLASQIQTVFSSRRKPALFVNKMIHLSGGDFDQVQRLSDLNWSELKIADINGYRDGYVFLSTQARLFMAPNLMTLALKNPRIVAGDNLSRYLSDELGSETLPGFEKISPLLHEDERRIVKEWAISIMHALGSQIDGYAKDIILTMNKILEAQVS